MVQGIPRWPLSFWAEKNLGVPFDLGLGVNSNDFCLFAVVLDSHVYFFPVAQDFLAYSFAAETNLFRLNVVWSGLDCHADFESYLENRNVFYVAVSDLHFVVFFVCPANESFLCAFSVDFDRRTL